MCIPAVLTEIKYLTHTKFQMANTPPTIGVVFALAIKMIEGSHTNQIKRQQLFKVESEELLTVGIEFIAAEKPELIELLHDAQLDFQVKVKELPDFE